MTDDREPYPIDMPDGSYLDELNTGANNRREWTPSLKFAGVCFAVICAVFGFWALLGWWWP